MRRLKNDYSLISYLLLGVITFGIYPIWILHNLVRDVNDICREDGRRSPGVLQLILLSLVTLGLYSFFWYYRIGDMLERAARRNRELRCDITGGYILICFVLNAVMCYLAGWVGLHKIFEATNILATDYNSKLFTKQNLGVSN